MNYKMSFRERAAQAMMRLSRQSPITLEEAQKQALWLKKNTKTSIRKKRD